MFNVSLNVFVPDVSVRSSLEQHSNVLLCTDVISTRAQRKAAGSISWFLDEFLLKGILGGFIASTLENSLV
jgi:hypothetical protein